MSARINKVNGRLVELNPRSIKPEDEARVAEAKQKEHDSLRKYGVYERVPVSSIDVSVANVLPTKWVLTKKLASGQGSAPRSHEERKVDYLWKYKARLAARGDLDDTVFDDVATAMPPLSSLRALFAFAVARDNFMPDDIQQADVSTAFLNAVLESEVPVYVHPPKDHPDYGVYVWLLKRALYGLRQAPRMYEKHFQNNVINKLRYVPTIFDGVYVRYTDSGEFDGALFVWVDDLFAVSGKTKAADLLREIGQLIEITFNGIPIEFLGMDIDVHPDCVLLHQGTYASFLLHDVDTSRMSIPNNPLPLDVLKDYERVKSNSPVLDKAGAFRYRSVLGSLAHLQHTRLDLCFAISFFGWFSAAPTAEAWRLLVRCAYFAKLTASTGIVFRVRPIREFKLEAYCDASFGKHAHTGYVVAINGAPILWRSSKQRCVALSTVKAELRAMFDCLDSMILIMHLLTTLHVKCCVRLFSDAKDLVSLLTSPHPKPAEKHLLIELRTIKGLLDSEDVMHNRAVRVRELSSKRIDRELDDCVRLVFAVQELVQYMPSCHILIQHVPGATNPADALTKPVDVRMLVSRYMHLF
jgi:hypothetical protein